MTAEHRAKIIEGRKNAGLKNFCTVEGYKISQDRFGYKVTHKGHDTYWQSLEAIARYIMRQKIKTETHNSLQDLIEAIRMQNLTVISCAELMEQATTPEIG